VKRGLALYAVLAYCFLHAPLFVLAIFSVNRGRFTVWEGWSLHWYTMTLRDGQLGEATWNSLVIATVATLLSTVIGTLCAYGLWKRNSRWLTMSMYASLLTPEIVMGIGLLVLFQLVFRVFSIQLGLHTVILAHVTFCLSFVVVVIGARLRTVDKALEEAALDLGATEWEAFRHVTLPSLAPGIGAAALLAFTTSFDDYVITSMVAGVDSETLPMVVYAMARRGANPVVNALSTLIVVGLGLLIAISSRLQES
jgi:spermidine/putrescine transport system permease protein